MNVCEELLEMSIDLNKSSKELSVMKEELNRLAGMKFNLLNKKAKKKQRIKWRKNAFIVLLSIGIFAAFIFGLLFVS